MFEKFGVLLKKCSCMFLDKLFISCCKFVISIRSFGNDVGFFEWFFFIEIFNVLSMLFWIFLMILFLFNLLVFVVIKKKSFIKIILDFF